MFGDSRIWMRVSSLSRSRWACRWRSSGSVASIPVLWRNEREKSAVSRTSHHPYAPLLFRLLDCSHPAHAKQLVSYGAGRFVGSGQPATADASAQDDADGFVHDRRGDMDVARP